MSSQRITVRSKQGRAIARGIAEYNTQKEKNQAKADKRKDTMFRNAANNVFINNGSAT